MERIIRTEEVHILATASTFPQVVRRLADMYGSVSVEFNGMTDDKGYIVRLHGIESIVRLCLSEQFSFNYPEGSVREKWWLDSMLGDQLAAHRLSSGCLHDLDSDTASRFMNEGDD